MRVLKKANAPLGNRIVLSLATFFGVVTVDMQETVLADCSTSGTTITCTGDLSGGEAIDADDASDIIIEDLTADAGEIEVTASTDDGDDGTSSTVDGGDADDTGDVAISFDGGSAYGIDSSDIDAFSIVFSAGSGGDGKNENEEAGDGGDGGSVGQSTLTVSDATTFEGDENIIYYVTTGGDGGKGGEGKNTSSQSGNGGKGGDGGDGGDQAIEITSGELTEMTVGNGSFIYLSSQGGTGGKGGEGKGEGANLTDVHGGNGNTGGDGGDVSIALSTTASGSGSTTSDDTPGIRVESLGGDGGQGGNANGGDIKGNGGDGGDGGAGGSVEVDLTTMTVETSGDRSIGILARSYGGSGGSHGESKTDSGSDGDGGSGGDGGAVTATFDGTIITRGNDGAGILLQSVGGFGADAGSSDITSFGSSSEDGGTGGDTKLTLNSDSSISTTGDGADGVHVQSVGGSGGKGQSDDSISALGGDGSAGGDGGTVTVSIEDGAQISTGGEHSSAVVALSVGGGGGSGGSANGITAVGGAGGSGGDGGEVTVTIGAATLQTSEGAAYGVYAASIGGGGGTARSTSGISSVGGSGGDGGDGGDVTVTLDGASITTSVGDSSGVVLHSIGGGGGSGSNATAVGAAYSKAVGGTGGDGGDAGTLELVSGPSVGSIITTADRSTGAILQSVGGGGGNSGDVLSVSAGIVADYAVGNSGGSSSGGDGGEVTVDETGFTIDTSGDHSHGLMAQSIGGSGGNSGSSITYTAVSAISVTVAVGSSDGEGGDGGKTTVTIGQDITTSGDKSHGVLSQSIGGGGGSSGHTLVGSSISTGSFEMSVGGSGSDGGDSKAVSVTVDADVTTNGRGSDGIVAQAIGGGGGSSGWTSDVDAFSSVDIQLTTGGSGGDGGGGARTIVFYEAGNEITVSGDNSVGIRAQSIGGGGGSSDVTISGDLGGTAELSIQTGGSGGDGGVGGTVEVSNKGDIYTEGDNGIGILAQSIAQSGGSSALSVNGDVDITSVSFTVEGNGGDGGGAGDVTLKNEGTVTTLGDYAGALTAQSLGGGGGSATGVISGQLTMSEINTAIGGSGGESGSAGTVTVESSGALSTAGVYSYGLLAQSLGGDGGVGGYSNDASVSASEFTANVDVAVGGDGGKGNDGNDIEITVSGDISTSEYGSRGIQAQSIGGSGGNGGAVYSGEIALSSGNSIEMDLTIGGDGGDSGTGGDITITNSGDISTGSFFADGIFGQTVGGDGGAGGISFASAADGDVDGGITFATAIGGEGGDGAVAGDVSIKNDGGTIITQSGSSSGIYAQSIGGNGGHGGAAATLVLDLTSTSSATVDLSGSVAVGADGGTGGDAGSVEVDNEGAISVSGNAARGIFAQSIGGGGGNGGSADAYLFATLSSSSESTSASFKLDMAFGGDGGAGGDGNTVTITNTETIETEGIAGYGIFGQSVGGGGGNGGDASSGINDYVAVLEAAISSGQSADESTFEKYLYTAKDIAEDIYDLYSTVDDLVNVERVLTEFEMDIGGSGGASGDGAKVKLVNSGSITTSGDSGTAIFGQSVGGGGGSGGDGSGGDLTDLTVGGNGSGGGDGGEVNVENTGTILTGGAGAMGIFAQSVGGGGGAGGDVELGFGESFTSSTFGVGVVDAESGGDGGDGGEVVIISEGTITTTGDQAHGIWAQSIGGSGGALGADNTTTLTDSIVGNAGDEGDGGDIDITVKADIALSGDYSTAIFAQTLGGDDGDGGDVTIELDADVTSSGTGGWGLVVQSDGYDDAGDVEVTLSSDASIYTGSSTNDGNEALYVLGADTFTLTNDGTIGSSRSFSTDDDVYTVYVEADSTMDIDISGTISGSVYLSSGGGTLDSSFTIEDGGLFETGAVVDMGDEFVLYNNGTISPGGEDNIFTTSFSAYFHGSSTGSYLIDLDMDDDTSDLMEFTTVYSKDNLWYPEDGTVNVNITSASTVSSGDSGKVTIATSADDKIDVIGFGLSAEDSATVDYSISTASDDHSVYLSWDVDYSPSTLSSINQLSAGNYIDTLVAASVAQTAAAQPTGSDYTFVQDLTKHVLEIATIEELQQNYDRIAPGDVFAATDAAVFSSLRFSGLLDGCGHETGGNVQTHTMDGTCVWLSAGYSRLERDRHYEAIDYSEDSYGTAAGLEVELQPNLFGGFGISYDEFTQRNGRFSSDGYRLQAGAGVRWEIGATTLSGSLSGGLSEYDFNRRAFSTDGAPMAKAEPNVNWFAAHARIGHMFQLTDTWSIAPSFDVGVTSFRQDSFDERDGGDYQLNVSSIDGTVFSFNPAVDLTAQWSLGNIPTTATLRAGVLGLAGDTTRSATAGFDAVGSAGPTFVVHDRTDTWYADLGASLEAKLEMRISIEAGVGALISENTRNFNGLARLNFRF